MLFMFGVSNHLHSVSNHLPYTRVTFINQYLPKEQAKLNFKTSLLMPTNELSMAKTMNHCSSASSYEVGIKNVESVSNHLPLPK